MAKPPVLGVLIEKPRQFAVTILTRHADREGFIEDLFDEEVSHAKLKPEDRRLTQELCYGVVRWQSTLDYFIEKLTEGRRQVPPVRAILRVGFYQLLMLDRIPDHAAVNESVNLTRELGFANQTGFINAIMRNCIRDREKFITEWNELKTSQPNIGWSHPKWLVERWQERMSAEDLQFLLEWNNTPPSVYARLNPVRTLPENTIKAWRDENVDYEFCSYDWVPENLVFRFKSHPPLAKIDSFQNGSYYIQDPSTLLSIHVLDPQPGERILDLCAAPGGKTTYIAQLIDDDGEIFAADSSPDRLELIRENCKRMHITSVEAYTLGELENHRRNGGDLFDRILIDAPCSNTGVIRRRVDLRWRIRPEEIERLKGEQLQLLDHAKRLLKPGGTIVYSTCSIEPEENEDVIEKFCETNPDYKLKSQRGLFPPDEKVDGAFVAKLAHQE